MPDAPIPVVKPPEAPLRPSPIYTEYYGAVFLSLIALFVLNALFILKPIIDQIKETNAQTQTELKVAEGETAYLASLEQSITAAQTISPAVLDRVTQALPVEANTPALLVEFGSAAHTNGIQIDSIAFAENKASSRLGQNNLPAQIIPIDITLSLHARNYFDLKRFLTDLETSLRVIDVVSMATAGGKDEVIYSLQLRSYAFGSQAPTR